MAQIGGLNTKTLVTEIELLSDDGNNVLTITHLEAGGAMFKVRKPWESTWDSGLPTFTVASRPSEIVTKVISGSDAKYNRSHLDEIDGTRFVSDNPNPPELDAAKLEYEARCTELDIERARAANIQQEFILDHSRDRHMTGLVDGCPSCENKVIPSLPPLRDYDVDENIENTAFEPLDADV